jgi:hypothetical protein
MTSRASSRSILFLCVVALLVAGAVPTLSDEQSVQSATTRSDFDIGTRARDVLPLHVRMLIRDTIRPPERSLEEVFAEARASLFGKPQKGVKVRFDIHGTDPATGGPLCSGSRVRRTNRNGTASASVDPKDIGCPLEDPRMFEVVARLQGRKNVSQVTLVALYGPHAECVRNSTATCLRDGIGARFWDVQGNTRTPIPLQSDNPQEARFGNQHGSIQIKVFSACNNPNHNNSNQLQFFDAYNRNWMAEVFQESTGYWRQFWKPSPGSGSTLNISSGPFCP